MAKFLVMDPGEFIAIDPKTGEEKFRAKTNIADANGDYGDKIDGSSSQTDNLSVRNTENKLNKKYPINELHHLRYCLHTAAVDGVRKHPSKEIADLGLEILAFDGCPLIECDFVLVRAEKLPPLPRYIEDISIDKDGKKKNKKWFPEFVLEED